MLLDVGFEFTVEAANDGDETSLPAETPPLGRDIIKVHRKSNIHKIIKKDRGFYSDDPTRRWAVGPGNCE